MTSLFALPLLSLFALVPAPAQVVSPDAAEVVIYDVRDLVPPDVHAPDSATAGAVLLAHTIEAQWKRRMQAGESVQPANGALVVRGGPAMQQWVKSLCDSIRDSARSLIQVDVQVFEMPEASAAELMRSDPVRLEPDDGAAGALLERALALPKVDVQIAPRLVVVPLQSAKLAVGDAIEYVEGYDAHESVLPGPTRLVVPRIARVEPGMAIDFVAVPLPDGLVAVEFALKTTTVAQPVPTESTPDGPIARPVTTVRSMETRVVLTRGGTAFFPTVAADGRTTIVALKVRFVAPEKLETK